MKKFTLLFASVLLVAAVNAQTPPPATSAPDITKVLDIKEADHNFGKIAYGKPVEFDVVIKNIGKDSVKIENVKVGCGCTTPRYEQGKSYGPGETFKVTLGFSGYAEGHFEKFADIFFSGGLQKQVKFHGEGFKVPEAPAPANGSVEKMKTGKTN